VLDNMAFFGYILEYILGNIGHIMDPLRAENRALPTQKGGGMAFSQINQSIVYRHLEDIRSVQQLYVWYTISRGFS